MLEMTDLPAIPGNPNILDDSDDSYLAAAKELELLLLNWVRVKVGEGQAILQKEPAWPDIQKAMDYVNGKQGTLKAKALSKTSDNRLRKVMLETVSSLTDVRPIWNYDTHNEEFKTQATVLNNLARGWWKNNAIDRKLQSVLSYASVGGSGYAALVWDEALPGGGDFTILPFDPRDVLPIEPVYSDSIQDWGGVILRQRMPIEAVKQTFPSKADKIIGNGGTWFGGQSGPSSNSLGQLLSGVWSVLTRGSDDMRGLQTPKMVDVIRVWYKDPSLNRSDRVITVGDPDKNWSYEVGPMQPLYPRGRHIICTPETILLDGPNPYWHGQFPLIRFTLDPLPWTLLGASMIADLIPLQDAYNEGLRGLEDGMGQWIRRGVVADRNAMSRPNLESIDTRKSGMQVLVNPTGGEGFKVVDGPTFPNWYMEYLALLKTEIDDLAGSRGLQQLAQLKQMPNADTMEKYQDALSPLLRLRARSIEISLGEMAEQLKVGFFQHYDLKRRMQILGRDGMTLEDFDYDPESLVPQGFDEETGEPIARDKRAAKHHKNFTFSIAPNSFLNVSHVTQKMLMLQLLRANLIDPWTAWKTFDLADTGKDPAETIPERIVEARRQGLMPGPPPEVVQAQNMMMLAQAQMAMAQMGAMMNASQYPQGTGGAQPGAPTSGVGPQGGRPPSGQEPPQFVQKDGGSRVAVSESGQ